MRMLWAEIHPSLWSLLPPNWRVEKMVLLGDTAAALHTPPGQDAKLGQEQQFLETHPQAHDLLQPPVTSCAAFRSRESGTRAERRRAFIVGSSQGLRSFRAGWGCRWERPQACHRPAPSGWMPSPRACRLPNRPTGLIPRPVYQEGSMSGSARQKPRNCQGMMQGGTQRWNMTLHPRVGGMINPRGVGKQWGSGYKSYCSCCFKANLCSCIETPCPPICS